jgi:hypothetical protein
MSGKKASTRGVVVRKESAAGRKRDTNGRAKRFEGKNQIQHLARNISVGVQCVVNNEEKAKFKGHQDRQYEKAPAAHRRSQNEDTNERQNSKKRDEQNNTNSSLPLAP